MRGKVFSNKVFNSELEHRFVYTFEKGDTGVAPVIPQYVLTDQELGSRARVTCVDICDDHVAVLTMDGFCRVYERRTFILYKKIEVSDTSCERSWALAFTDSSHLCVAVDNLIKLVNLDSGELVHLLSNAHNMGKISCMCCHSGLLGYTTM